MKEADYIIAGQGLAGTILAITLLGKGKRILIVDDPGLSSCSRVAAGNYNPIVFKRLVKSWMADEIIPFADRFFREAEKNFTAEFFWKKEGAKIFADERELSFWKKKSSEDDRYLSKNILHDFHTGVLQENAGCGIVKDAGKIYSSGFLENSRKYFLNKNLLLEEKFDFSGLQLQVDKAEYKGITSGKIIFCEGWKAMENPFFRYLPFNPAKGEILVLKIENFICDKIIHKNGYLYQIGPALFVAGTTYEWKELNDLPSEKGKNTIIEKLEKIIKVPYEIIGHFAGVRPSTKDRRPFIGLHPEHKALGIFNGFGTKAVMLAPYFADHFLNFLENGTELEPEINIARFNNN